MKYIIYIAAILTFSSCQKIFLQPEPQVTNLRIYDEYTSLIKEKYAMLDFKNVDIDILSASIRSSVTNDLTDKELFDKMSQLTLSLKDGHSNLAEDAGALSEDQLSTSYDFLEGFDPAFDIAIMLKNYIGIDENKNLIFLYTEDKTDVRMIYGTLPQSSEIAYVWIPSWNNEISDEEIEDFFAYAKDKKAMIVDIRQNTGGSPALATKFASYFLKEKTNTGFERFKTGPNANDFKDSPNVLHPAKSKNLYHNKVAVLIDRYVYSAALTFSYSLFPLDQVTFIGQRAGGGSGAVADGYLLNGWYWSLSVSEYFDYEGKHLDNGFEPDISVKLDLENKEKDEIIEKAIEHLNK